MPPQMSENLSRIASSSSQLNQLSKQATEQIRALSDYLNGLDAGVEYRRNSWIKEGREENSRNHRTAAVYRLAYGRDDDGKFGLIIEADAEKTDEDGNVLMEIDQYVGERPRTERIWTRRLDQTSRPIRIAAMKYISEFIAELADKISDTVNELRKNMLEAKDSTEELKAALGEVPLHANPDPELIKNLMSTEGPAKSSMSQKFKK